MRKSLKRVVSLGLFIGLMTGVPLSATTFSSNVPDAGQRGDWVLDTFEERKLGQNVLQKINILEARILDPVLHEYLQGLQTRLQKAAPPIDFKLHFFCIEHPSINAMTFFGGHVAITHALIVNVAKESELAAVMSHETAHIAQHHLARIVTTHKKMMPITMAQVLAAMLIGALGNPEAGIHLATASLGGHTQRMINFTRDHEEEADRFGLKILAKAGYNPQSMVTVFQTLSNKSRHQTKPPDYFLTHPHFNSRMADTANRLSEISYTPVDENPLFYLAQARLALLGEDPREQLARFREKLNNHQGDKLSNEYGFALALAKCRRYTEAMRIMENLRTHHPGNWAIQYGIADIAEMSGDYETAKKEMKRLHEAHPSYYGLGIRYAELLLIMKEGESARNILLKYKNRMMEDPLYFQLLARSYHASQEPARMHNAKAYWHYLRGEFVEAIKQLDLGLEYAGNSYFAKELKARKEAFEEDHEAFRKL